MSQNPAYRPMSAMEDDILAVERWAGVLNHMGTGTCMIDPGEVWVISNVLAEVGKRLDARWNEAFDAAAGRAR
ncbi:hypothetical protein MKK69_02840 [Methylobacterium sp. J-026]|uniref:hypothetical protein n=1 Tax=Methylobacterium sp. J-026 TaxID=2836624 RepID=UPI001FB9006B|nr:hypothetical protein [Methylobacterium sp. J-026]MCJ2133014.1 hypothetical protein [Methylobacterium sp. J-026]